MRLISSSHLQPSLDKVLPIEKRLCTQIKAPKFGSRPTAARIKDQTPQNLCCIFMFGSQGDTIFLFWVSRKKSLGTPALQYRTFSNVNLVLLANFHISRNTITITPCNVFLSIRNVFPNNQRYLNQPHNILTNCTRNQFS